MMKRLSLSNIKSVFYNNRFINRYRGYGSLFNFFSTLNYLGVHVLGSGMNVISRNLHNNHILAKDSNNSSVDTTMVFKDVIKGGYKGYSVLNNFGNVQYLLNNPIEFNNLVSQFIKSLDGNNTYTLLSVVKYFYYESGQTEGLTVGSSIKVNNKNIVYNFIFYKQNLEGEVIDKVINEVLQDKLPMNSIDVENTVKKKIYILL